MNKSKENIEVKDFWEKYSCGEKLYLNSTHKEGYSDQSKIRYSLEPYILNFLKFNLASNSKVLEIGVGLGADHQQIAEQGYQMYGIDLTQRAIDHTKNRFFQFNLCSNLSVSNAEKLNFQDNFFDAIYSWGVIHHSIYPEQIISEIHRTLKKRGTAKIMLYHKYSIVMFMLWLRYGLFKGKLFMSLLDISKKYLESPGTKVYTRKEVNNLFIEFSRIKTNIVLSHADLLDSDVGQRHRGKLLKFAKFIWPRKLVRLFLRQFGLFMLITVEK